MNVHCNGNTSEFRDFENFNHLLTSIKTLIEITTRDYQDYQDSLPIARMLWILRYNVSGGETLVLDL